MAPTPSSKRTQTQPPIAEEVHPGAFSVINAKAVRTSTALAVYSVQFAF
jgi:hypothetical protein